MSNLKVIEIKAFIPAKDFELSKRFYQDVGFKLASSGGGIAYLHYGSASFLLQDFYAEALAKDFTMHLLVEDIDAWWQQLTQAGIAAKYGVTIGNIETQPWRMRDFELTDPSGVCWRIAQNIG
ncbi:MAG TPA: VOC family protein [Steroidobacteraceae bacterium]|jgi:hypothetical protein|nr:VOC family protein [Steroidobacteraceae bacterium]